MHESAFAQENISALLKSKRPRPVRSWDYQPKKAKEPKKKKKKWKHVFGPTLNFVYCVNPVDTECVTNQIHFSFTKRDISKVTVKTKYKTYSLSNTGLRVSPFKNAANTKILVDLTVFPPS